VDLQYNPSNLDSCKCCYFSYKFKLHHYRLHSEHIEISSMG